MLIWLPTSRREAAARRLLTQVWCELDDPHTVPVATASATLLDPASPRPSPADAVWLPLDAKPGTSRRRLLVELCDVWHHLLPARTSDDEGEVRAPESSRSTSSLPAPMPPSVGSPGPPTGS